MSTSARSRRSAAGARRLRKTRRVLDREGKPAPLVTLKDLRERTGTVLRQTDRCGAVAIAKGGKPIAVALAPDFFVSLCVDYACASIGASRPE